MKATADAWVALEDEEDEDEGDGEEVMQALFEEEEGEGEETDEDSDSEAAYVATRFTSCTSSSYSSNSFKLMCEKRQSGYIACNCTTDITCNKIAARNKP